MQPLNFFGATTLLRPAHNTPLPLLSWLNAATASQGHSNQAKRPAQVLPSGEMFHEEHPARRRS